MIDVPSINEPVLLMQVANEYEANNIIALLSGEGIPTYISHKGSGQYLNIAMGMSNMGVDIYVPKSAYERANEIIFYANVENKVEKIEDIKDDYLDYDSHDADDYEEDNSGVDNNNRGYKGIKFARILLIPLAAALAYLLIGFLKYLIEYFTR
jgi:hypothetical protein